MEILETKTTQKEKKINHEVLNAKFHEQEAKIIGYAGTPGAAQFRSSGRTGRRSAPVEPA